MTLIIDSHQDLAYNALTFNRDYRRSTAETRRLEAGSPTVQITQETTLGWPEYQRAQVAVIVATLFIMPQKYVGDHTWDTEAYATTQQADRLYRKQVDFYRRLSDETPDQFRLLTSRAALQAHLAEWEAAPASETVSHPVGLVMSLEGAEGLPHPRTLEEYAELGLHLLGPVWSGMRYCGGSYEPQGSFTAEGYELLDVMAALNFTLDVAHMNAKSALQAVDRYSGTVICSHANARALLREGTGERHLTDETIRALLERGAVIGVMPFNGFLLPGWKPGDDRSLVTLDTLAAHIDHICQMAGNTQHVGIGSDFDGGFGYPAIPQELNTIADLPLLGDNLRKRGYSESDIAAIFSGNWRRILERSLP